MADKQRKPLFGLLSLTFGGMAALPMLGVLSLPGMVFGLLALYRRQWATGCVGVAVSIIMLVTSPTVWVLLTPRHDLEVAKGTVSTILRQQPAAIMQAVPLGSDDTRSTATAIATTMTHMADSSHPAPRFLYQLNQARVALALRLPDTAQAFISDARGLSTLVTSSPASKTPTAQVKSYRIDFTYDPAHPHHYFPPEGVGAGSKVSWDSGPWWSRKGLSIAQVGIVYLSIDLSDDKVERHLAAARSDIAANNLSDAQRELAELNDEAVKEDNQAPVSADTLAYGTLALALGFDRAGNLDGLRISLRAFDAALDAMERDGHYATQRDVIDAMRNEVTNAEVAITEVDADWAKKMERLLMSQWYQQVRELTSVAASALSTPSSPPGPATSLTPPAAPAPAVTVTPTAIIPPTSPAVSTAPATLPQTPQR